MIEVVEREYKMGPGMKLKLGNINGYVKMEGYEGDTLKLRAEKKWGLLGAEPKIKIKKEGDTLIIKVKQKRSFGVSIGESAVNFELLIPKEVEVEVASVNGSITVKNISKAGKIATVNGRIDVENVEARKISTVNGTIKALMTRISNDAGISTVNGSIEVYVPKNANVEVKASTVNGKINTDIPGEISKTPIYGPKSFMGVLGEGRHKLKVSAVNGSITIKLR
ncbi:hypothetical protein EP1X_00480 [Thermococcus sp. EP1]|uniref:DUF4097 family beta strand repeat-containing protein n=1 Tax=Thermococcus sp. EP1 TaxID=1591054 RepID=UPI0006DBA0C6|nr:DUF4097 family beta strand repeat-containing protein [Thermococcus sp. EP1]KPU63717.1 hypothetical protein EP1X_00480 [Thermococcus sp. EP1]